MRFPSASVTFAFLLLASAVHAQQQQPQQTLPPAPGTLVDVGGRKLHMICSGSGAPVVVLEAGASSFAIDWTLVQREVARTNRVCSYDRAGMGWSEASTPANRATAAQDLHRLLTAAGERGPYVLVGASRGGLLVRVYQAEYPAEVAGLVFVDPSSEDRLFTMIAGEARLIADVTAEQMRSTAPNRTIAVPRRSPQMGTPFDRLPPDLYQTRIRLDEKQIAALPDSVPPEIIVTSNENERALLARLRAARNANKQPLGDRPVVVLTRGDDKNADREAVHAAIAQLSTNSRHTVVADAGHEIHLFNPPVVAQAIADVVDAIRTSRPLPRR